MRVLASYVMRGRKQAIIVAMLATISLLFAWLGAAVVALVILAQGWRTGLYVAFWVLAPALVFAGLGDSGPLIGLLGTVLAALVLAAGYGWSLALLTGSLLALLAGGLLFLFDASAISAVLELLDRFFVQSMDSTSTPLIHLLPSAVQVVGLLSFGYALTISVSLLLARWWQAVLYRPGAFKEEFQAFRIAPQLTALLVIMALLLWWLGGAFSTWAFVLTVPLMFAGFALVHAAVNKRQLGVHWLVLFYLAWLFLDPVKLLIIALVVWDSFLPIKARS